MGQLIINKLDFIKVSSLIISIILVFTILEAEAINYYSRDGLKPKNLVNSYFPNLIAMDSNIMFELNYS